MIEWLKQFFCHHDWRQSPFVALNDGRPAYECRKCGKWHHGALE
jgi:hypothetical protein